jgi:putative ABC transport system substrate-binding protein
MQRREFIGLIGGAAFRPLAARGEQSRRVPVVGILWHAGSAEEEAAFSRPLKAGFADLGYVEGKTIVSSRNVILLNKRNGLIDTPPSWLASTSTL